MGCGEMIRETEFLESVGEKFRLASFQAELFCQKMKEVTTHNGLIFHFQRTFNVLSRICGIL